ncbi:type II 3-dehydroquinate dehydratase [Jiangella anatolica]|uniref:3-dehydroquinate dehydratase n=1 Tax=Jiangella anatolica TaxID=2670374 RepID=A0A2W2BYR3_9ACTN|nr:type II 3-dehydroquinate dehydratase [Jiangella anatolica]PZF85634.1 type II 3-dehydroquinate dehydratase [Jiangella anatolica]
MTATKVHVLNGPNLNLLGAREPGVYGSGTLDDLRRRCEPAAAAAGVDLDFRQSNHEGELVDWVHEAGRDAAAGVTLGAVLNLGAYTHTSIALRDAVSGAGLPAIEVHLSNVHAREPFRDHSHLAPVAIGVVAGLGPDGYAYAIDALARRREHSTRR